MRTSVIRHTAGDRFLILRSEYIQICGGDHCSAALLAVFEFAVNGRVEDPRDIPWIPKTIAEIQDSMLGHYSRDMVSKAVKNLQERGFLKVRVDPGATPHYLLCVDEIQGQLEVNEKSVTPGCSTRKIGDPPPKNRYPPTEKSCTTPDAHITTARARSKEERKEDKQEDDGFVFSLTDSNLYKGLQRIAKEVGGSARMMQDDKKRLKQRDEFIRRQSTDGDEWLSYRQEVEAVARGWWADSSIGTLGQAVLKVGKSSTPHSYQRVDHSAQQEPLTGVRKEIHDAMRNVYPALPKIHSWQWGILEYTNVHDGSAPMLKRLIETLQQMKDGGSAADGAVLAAIDGEKAEQPRIRRELEERRTFQRIADDIERDLQAEARKKGFANGQI